MLGWLQRHFPLTPLQGLVPKASTLEVRAQIQPPIQRSLYVPVRTLERTSDVNAMLSHNETIEKELTVYIIPRIRELLEEHPVVLFMKGTPDAPECGFSKYASMLLTYNGIEFVGVNVLDDPALRQGIKLYRNWPTIPQLYVHGELVGGSDIIQKLHEAGQLREACGLLPTENH
nr:Glutaredoxin-related protein [Giardia muris]